MTTQTKLPEHDAPSPTVNAAPSGQGIWRLMSPVWPGIVLAMGMAATGVILALGAVACLAGTLSGLLRSGGQPWLWFAAAVILTVGSFFLRVHAFKISHLAAFDLEVILRKGMNGTDRKSVV